jgi:ATP-dependent RNA helicase DDX21
MHGDVGQHAREVALRKFKAGLLRVLVATDVASRGLDIPNVELVVQVQPPQDAEVYIHRSGRTARAGKDGICITLYGKKDSYLLDVISGKCGVEFEEIQIPNFSATQTANIHNDFRRDVRPNTGAYHNEPMSRPVN